MRARITGTGAYAPAKVLTNADLERMVATSDEWIVERTGIRERHVASPGEACSDLAVKAAERALIAAGVPVVLSSTPDSWFTRLFEYVAATG